MGDFVVRESARGWDGVPSGVIGSVFADWSMEAHDDEVLAVVDEVRAE